MAAKQPLEVHKCVKNFPPMTEEEYNALKNSVRELGLQTPVTVWKDANGKSWVIDGRNRVKVLNELMKEKVRKALNGEELVLKAVPFEGTESEAIHWASSLNGNRRNVSSSQLAMSATLSYLDELDALKSELKAQGKEVPKRDPNGDIAERLAKAHGTNRQYIFDCLYIVDVSHQIAQKVVKGEKSIPEALRGAKRKEKDLVPFPTPEQKREEEEGDKERSEPTPQPKATGGASSKKGDDKQSGKASGSESGTTPEPEPEAEKLPPVYDGLKQEVSEEHREIFQARDEVREICKAIANARALFDNYARGDGGSWCKQDETVADFLSLMNRIRKTQPYCICPYCDGVGKLEREDKKTGEKKLAKCGQCNGAKFMDELQYKVLPAELKEKVLAAGGKEE